MFHLLVTFRMKSTLTICRVMSLILTAILMISIVVIWWFHGEHVQQWLNHPAPAFNCKKCSDNTQSHIFDQSLKNFTNIPCFHRWIYRDINLVKERFHRLLSVEELWKRRRYPTNEKDQCVISHLSIGNSRFVHHFAHFAEAYFAYFSTLLWHQRLYQYEALVHGHRSKLMNDSYPQHRSCQHINSLLIGDHSSFWDVPLASHKWMEDIVDIVDQQFSIQSIQSTQCITTLRNDNNYSMEVIEFKPREESWFLHPSDSLLLTSLILNQSPCRYHNQKDALVLAPIRIGLIGRRGTRKILNEAEIVRFLSSIQHVNVSSVSGEMRTVSVMLTDDQHVLTTSIQQDSIAKQHINISNDASFMSPRTSSMRHKVPAADPSAIYFEKLTFREQVELMHSLDIAITVHGAGETNIAFMKPCSIVIEVFPYGFYIPDDFGSLALKVGLLHYSWQEASENTIRTHDFQERKYCKDVLKRFFDPMKSNKFVNQQSNNNQRNDKQLSECLQNGQCRSCAREADGVLIQQSTLYSVLVQAVQDRANCTEEHPYYSNKE